MTRKVKLDFEPNFVFKSKIEKKLKENPLKRVVAWRGGGGESTASLLNSSLHNFPKGPPLWYNLMTSIFGEKPQNFCKGTFGANMTYHYEAKLCTG